MTADLAHLLGVAERQAHHASRPWVTGPDGRTYRGRRPDDLPDRGEGPYIASLARAVGGVCEVGLSVGRADVMTDTHVYEVEPVASWRTGARQAFAYAGMTGATPALALFGRADYLPIFLRVRDRLKGLELWVWDGYGWIPITSRRDALRKYPSRAWESSGLPEGLAEMAERAR